MADEIVTSDWSKFGYREIEEAKELLSHIKEIDSYGKVEVMFNTHSGYVFLFDEDYKAWRMNGDKIEEWYHCHYCGHEGFLEDMKHEPEDEECREYMQELGILVEEMRKKMNEPAIKKEEYKLLKEGIFNDAHPFFKGLVVKAEKVGSDYMITVNEGRTWTNLYTTEEACMKVFNRMTKEVEE